MQVFQAIKNINIAKLFKWILSFFTLQFLLTLVISYLLIDNTRKIFQDKVTQPTIDEIMSFDIQDTHKLIIQNNSEKEISFSKRCVEKDQSYICTSTILFPDSYVDSSDYKTLNISCAQRCSIEINSTNYHPINVFIYGKEVKLNIEYLKTINFLMDSIEGSITIRELVFDTAKINLSIGNMAFQTSENLAVTSVTSQKYLCITSLKSYQINKKTQAISTIDDISDIIITKDQGDCLKVFPYEQRNHSQMIKDIKHPLFDNLQNTQMMQFEEVRCNYFDNLILMSSNDHPSQVSLKQLFISNSQGNIYLNVVDNKKKMGSLLFNDEFQSNSKLNFTEKSAYNIQQTIQKLSNSGRSQDILLLNFQNNYETTSTTFIILFNPISLFATPLTISLFSFGTLSNTQEQQFPDLLPNICPYIFSRESLDTEYSKTVLDQRKKLFENLIQQYFYQTETKTYACFDYEVYNKIDFMKINTYPDQDEAAKRLKIINLSLIPFFFIGAIILYKAFSLIIYYLNQASEQRKEKDKEKILFTLITYYQNQTEKKQSQQDLEDEINPLSKNHNNGIYQQSTLSSKKQLQFVNVCQLTLKSIQYLYQAVMNWSKFQQINSFELYCKILFIGQGQTNPINKEKIAPDISEKAKLDKLSEIEQGNSNKELKDDEIDLDEFKKHYQLFCYIYNLNEQFILSEESLKILFKYGFHIKYKEIKNTKQETLKVICSFDKTHTMNTIFLKKLFNFIKYNYIILKHRKYKNYKFSEEFQKFKNSLKKMWYSIRSFNYFKSCLILKENDILEQYKSLEGSELLKLIKKDINNNYQQYIFEREEKIKYVINSILRAITAIAVPIAFFSPTIIIIWIFKEENSKYVYNLEKIYGADFPNISKNFQSYETITLWLFWSAISQGITFLMLLFLNGMNSFSSITKNTQYVYFQYFTRCWEKYQKKIFYLKFYDLLGKISTYLLIVHLLIQVAYVYIGLIIIIIGSIVFTKVELPFLIFLSFLISVIGQLSHNFYVNYENGKKKLFAIFFENYKTNVQKYKEIYLSNLTREGAQVDNNQDKVIDYKLTIQDELFIQFKFVDSGRNGSISLKELEKHFENINMNLNNVQINLLHSKLLDKSKSKLELQQNIEIGFDNFKKFIEGLINQKVQLALFKIGVSYEVLLRTIFKILSISIFVGFFLYIIFVSFITSENNLDLLSSNGIISSGGIASIFILREDRSSSLNDEKVLKDAVEEVERIFHYNNHSQQFNSEIEILANNQNLNEQTTQQELKCLIQDTQKILEQ